MKEETVQGPICAWSVAREVALGATSCIVGAIPCGRPGGACYRPGGTCGYPGGAYSPCSLHCFVDRGDTLASTDAHSDKRILAAGATEFVQGFHRQDTARCPDGVSKRNAAPIRVCAIKRQVQIPHYSQSLGSEGLIQLNHIHILDGQVGAFEHLPYRWHWPDTHVLRIHSSMCIGDQPSQRLQAAS